MRRSRPARAPFRGSCASGMLVDQEHRQETVPVRLHEYHPATRPLGPLSGPRRRWRRIASSALTGLNNALFPTPLGRWLHWRLHSRLDLSVVDLDLGGGSLARSQGAWPSIAFLSDLHAGHYMTAQDLEALARLLSGLAPDLVCLGGDLINTHDEELRLLDRALEHLRAPLGVFAVPGNHDYFHPGPLVNWEAHLEALGVQVLINRGVRLTHGGGTFWLCGVDDLTEGTPRLEDALAGRSPGEPAILLSHHPDVFQEASEREVDLQLSGHTHGGQIRLLGWSPLHHSRFGYVQGTYERNGSRLYVGRGAGVTALPVRIGTRSEVALLRARSG